MVSNTPLLFQNIINIEFRMTIYITYLNVFKKGIIIINMVDHPKERSTIRITIQITSHV